MHAYRCYCFGQRFPHECYSFWNIKIKQRLQIWSKTREGGWQGLEPCHAKWSDAKRCRLHVDHSTAAHSGWRCYSQVFDFEHHRHRWRKGNNLARYQAQLQRTKPRVTTCLHEIQYSHSNKFDFVLLVWNGFYLLVVEIRWMRFDLESVERKQNCMSKPIHNWIVKLVMPKLAWQS